MRCGCGSNAWELRAEQPFEICKGIHSAFKFIWHLFSPSFTFGLFQRPWHLVFFFSFFNFFVCFHCVWRIAFTSLANLFDIYGKADSANGYFASKQNEKTFSHKVLKIGEYPMCSRSDESTTFRRMPRPSFTQINTLDWFW